MKRSRLTPPPPPPSPSPSWPGQHPQVAAYLGSLLAIGKASTARTYGCYLRTFEEWARSAGLDLLTTTTPELSGYQLFLANDRTARTGAVRARSTQATAVFVVQSFYHWLRRRGHIIHDPAAALVPPHLPGKRMVRKDHLTLQECIALLQTQASFIDGHAPGSVRRALEIRNLALLSLALATGRRVRGLVDLRVDQVDLERNEIRVEREKGHVGRVLPVAEWAMATVRRYLSEARAVIAEHADLIDDGECRLPPAPLSEEQVTRLFQLLPGTDAVDLRNRLHVELLYGCALRLSETLNLDVADLDFRERTLLVRGGIAWCKLSGRPLSQKSVVMRAADLNAWCFAPHEYRRGLVRLLRSGLAKVRAVPGGWSVNFIGLNEDR